MKLVSFAGAKGLRTCLLVLLMLRDSVVTSQQKEMFLNALPDRRLAVAPRDVIAHSSAIRCTVECLATSWCVSANLFAGDGTCQLLSEEVSDVTSLETAVGWRHLRELSKNKTGGFRNYARKNLIVSQTYILSFLLWVAFPNERLDIAIFV